MTDILFYHLERQPLEKVLPALLEKSLERGWRALVRTRTVEVAHALDEALWSYAEDSFLPHALASEPFAEEEAIVLDHSDGVPNRPDVVFLVEGAAFPPSVEAFQRVVVMFDGNDEDGLRKARVMWKLVRSQGLEGTYWQQSEAGRWEKKA
jgi:DNA polymerase III subunit chi